jgi:hypothetical protein
VGGSSPFEISRPLFATAENAGQNSAYKLIDLAVVRLTAIEKQKLSQSFQFVPESAIEHSTTSCTSDDFAVVGYPGIEGNLNCFHPATSTITCNVTALPAILDRNYRHHSIDTKPSWYLRLGFKPFLPFLRTIGFRMRKLNGFSGGPIFRCSETGSWSFAGISVETYTRRNKLTLVGVSSKAVNDVIRHWWDLLVK